MKNKKTFIFIFLILTASLITNIIYYLNGRVPKIGTTASVFWYYDSVLADGYVKWNDRTLQPKTVRQHWLIKITAKECLFMDSTEWSDQNRSVYIGDPKQCEIIKLDSNNKNAMLRYGDATITIVSDNVSFLTNNSTEKGGGILVPSWKID